MYQPLELNFHKSIHSHVCVTDSTVLLGAADLLLCHLQFQRSIGEKQEHADLWIGYCAFHLGDYKRAMEVLLYCICVSECIQVVCHMAQ